MVLGLIKARCGPAMANNIYIFIREMKYDVGIINVFPYYFTRENV
jgi:hypothetical protein